MNYSIPGLDGLWSSWRLLFAMRDQKLPRNTRWRWARARFESSARDLWTCSYRNELKVLQSENKKSHYSGSQFLVCLFIYLFLYIYICYERLQGPWAGPTSIKKPQVYFTSQTTVFRSSHKFEFSKSLPVIEFSDLVDLWVIEILKLWSFAHVVHQDQVNRERNTEQAARGCWKSVYSVVKITRLYDYQHGRHVFGEIYEMRKGFWALFLDCAFRMLIGWAGKLRSLV